MGLPLRDHNSSLLTLQTGPHIGYQCNLGTLRPSVIKKSKRILLMKSSLFLEAATMANKAIEQQTIWLEL